jgi:hypothetical protein
MDRKEFLASMLVLGGAAIVPSVAKADALERIEKLVAKSSGKKIDSRLTVLLSDIHICGELKDGKSLHYPYNPTSLQLRIEEILSMRPLPANVIVFGDVAWDYGLEEDYRYAAELLRPLEDAGIKLTLGLGNHDRRAAFFKVFPQYAQTSPVKGRAVSVVALPDVDVVMLDSLAEKPNLKPRQATTVSGEVNEEQVAWLGEFLSQSKRPAILCAHHPLNEMPSIEKLISSSSNVAGFVYGHVHFWSKTPYIIRSRTPQRMVQTVSLPATFYGDIGMAVMRTDATGAKIEFSSKGYWWPQPSDNPPKEWQRRVDDTQHEEVNLLF